MIIGISGRIGVGKDLVGKIIQSLCDETYDGAIENVLPLDELPSNSNSWKIKKFADKLKDIVCLLTGCTREELEDQEFKDQEIGEEWKVIRHKLGDGKNSLYRYDYYSIIEDAREAKRRCHNFNINKIEEYTLTYRLLLQLLGTEAGRNIIHPNLWVISLFTDYSGDIEEWKDIKGYEGKYQISNFGRVKGLNRKIVYGDENKGEYHTKKESILKSTISGKYKMIKLEGNNSVTIHSLVATHFIPKVEGKSYINHIDQNPLNNFYKNLEWCTQSENIISANTAGNGNIGEKQADAKLTEKDVLEIKYHLKSSPYTQKKLAEMYNVSTTTICDIKKERKWKHVGNEQKIIEPILPKSNPNWIITDVRFPNEKKAIEDKDGFVIRINRPNINKLVNSGINSQNTNNHESETALDSAKFKYTIDNSGSINDLILNVKQILIKEKVI